MVWLWCVVYTLLLQFSLVSGAAVRISEDSSGPYNEDYITVAADPPSGTFSPSALGMYVESNVKDAIIFYTVSYNLEGEEAPPSDDNYPMYDNEQRFNGIDAENAIVTDTPNTYVAFNNTPYIHIDTPFGKGRNVRVIIIAVGYDSIRDEWSRSQELTFHYVVEASDRPKSYGFFVPGPETKGHFVSVALEMKATARAQSAKGQEFADFFADLGIGTYPDQVYSLHLPTALPGFHLEGFEGGFAMNASDGSHYGILVPYHNGVEFHGRVVRVNLKKILRTEDGGEFDWCYGNVRHEWMDSNGVVQSTGPATSESCVVVLDLASKHPQARGFRKGFAGYPYAYLAAGEFDVNVRLDIHDFTLASAVTLDLSEFDSTLGGFSGGFVDGSWACFCPFKEFAGTYGGIRSSSIVDRNTLRVYYASVMACINSTVWEGANITENNVLRIDMGDLDPGLRGYSEAIRVGRYAYLSPLASYTHTYTSKLVRIDLGPVDIATKLASLRAQGLRARAMLKVLDLSQKDSRLKGFSGLFTAGKYLLLSPYRNTHQPQIGQRGFGLFVRIDMNKFNLDGITILDLTTRIRAQIPSFADIDLKGYTGGFASGIFGYLVPFYNGVFSGKSARVALFDEDLGDNLQELDMKRHRGPLNNTFMGFRGGFTSLWQGLPTTFE